MWVKIFQLLGFGLGGMVSAAIINELLLRFSQSLGIRNKNDVVVRWSNESKPSLGGVSFFMVFVFTAIGYSVLFFEENIFHNIQFVGLFAAGSLAFLMGLADDAYNTKPLVKLAVQILCGLIMVWTHSSIDLFHNYWIDGALTVFWVVLIMNSLNMLDNMDGITGTVVLSILFSCLLSNWLVLNFNTNIWSLTIMAVIGAIMGFLIYNIHPSKIFMGDAGSQFIGLFVAFVSVENLWNVGWNTGNSSWVGLLVTLVAFTPAGVDTLTVVINRLKKGQSPMVGGKDHTTHHLVYAGLNDRQVWLVFLLISVIACILTVIMIDLLRMNLTGAILAFPVFFMVVFVVLFRNTKKFPEKGK